MAQSVRTCSFPCTCASQYEVSFKLSDDQEYLIVRVQHGNTGWTARCDLDEESEEISAKIMDCISQHIDSTEKCSLVPYKGVMMWPTV